MTIVTGTVARPAWSGDQPASCWRNSESRKLHADSPPYTANVSMLVTEKLRWENSRSGSIGCAARPSYRTNATRHAAPPTIDSATAGLLQPRRGCSMKPKTTPPSPAAQSAAPG